MKLEDQKDGCVPVANFYSGMMHGQWQFSENPEYLKELGALDDSDKENMRVMIPNYLDGASNCVASSTYYSVCCINECDEILGRVEKHIQAPDATSEELARLVSALPSSTMGAHRVLPASLVQRLDKIATSHGGRVPIHSRLFMQWMHNAFPHECPYPHVSGRTSPRSPETWMHDTHKSPMVTVAEVEKIIHPKQEASLEAGAKDDSMPHGHGQCGKWIDQEELYVPWTVHPGQVDMEQDAHAWVGTFSVGLLAAVASMMLMLIQTAKTYRSSTKKNMLFT